MFVFAFFIAVSEISKTSISEISNYIDNSPFPVRSCLYPIYVLFNFRNTTHDRHRILQ
jgi:hypothetical protein